MRALLLENIHPVASKVLEVAGFEVVTRKGALDEHELIDELRGFQLLGIRSKTEITTRVCTATPGLLAVGVFAARQSTGWRYSTRPTPTRAPWSS
jgi:D-3-phosphoglycerate dehydrogenase